MLKVLVGYFVVCVVGIAFIAYSGSWIVDSGNKKDILTELSIIMLTPEARVTSACPKSEVAREWFLSRRSSGAFKLWYLGYGPYHWPEEFGPTLKEMEKEWGIENIPTEELGR